MILIADSGSTKTDWCLISPGEAARFFTTEGYNPFFSDAASILGSLESNLPEYLNHNEVKAIHFYGAGCQDDQVAVMEDILLRVFPMTDLIEVEMDLLAAARGLLGHTPGFAAILGTGTNTCIYDGVKITHNIDSLGFILGDEGSGAAIGKKILSDYLRDRMPPGVRQAFNSMYALSAAELINRIYTGPQANRFCASFTKFLKADDVDKTYADKLLHTAFTDFFSQLVSCYPNIQEHSFNCIGSVAFHFKTQLLKVLDNYNMKPGRILPSLIAELAAYHTNRL